MVDAVRWMQCSGMHSRIISRYRPQPYRLRLGVLPAPRRRRRLPLQRHQPPLRCLRRLCARLRRQPGWYTAPPCNLNLSFPEKLNLADFQLRLSSFKASQLFHGGTNGSGQCSNNRGSIRHIAFYVEDLTLCLLACPILNTVDRHLCPPWKTAKGVQLSASEGERQSREAE